MFRAQTRNDQAIVICASWHDDFKDVTELRALAQKYFGSNNVALLGSQIVVRPQSLSPKASLAIITQVNHRLSARIKRSPHVGWSMGYGEVMTDAAGWYGPAIDVVIELAGHALPFGIIVDKQLMPEAPKLSGIEFVEQVRHLKFGHDVQVWVSSELSSQFIRREIVRETPEVHVAGSCFKISNDQISILFARRSMTRQLFPGKLEGCGGQLKHDETFQQGIKRHFKSELNYDVEPLEIYNLYNINKPGGSIPGIRFLCKLIKAAQPTLINHSELFWLTEKQFRATSATEFPDNLKNDLLELIDQYKGQANIS